MTLQSQTSSVSTAQPVELSELEKKYRMLKEDFASPDECRRLIELLEEHGEIGEGYGGNPHPHTPNETFGGYSFNMGKGYPGTPGHELGLELIQRARRQLQAHFSLPWLWLDYSQLVFREATGAGDEHEAEELSHPWHFDNQSEGVKYRTHAAILYVNDGFEGGETCFRETEFGPYREIPPKPGKLAGFSVVDNDHAVAKLRSGRRYVLNMWFSTSWMKFRKHR
ncbi:MAG: 2OG-Fe(II) oxygenase [Gammaproteobacteria bacterium]|jgi:hypothetical protein|nr:2OG-Fe(II) oxygenase [Gammaproteobacteria bacterium]MDP6615659.1 2OG-Fe(II) oxygenase [Gammaproteobacteria bacterium]MDP6694686.1 2OG-Fe(II) oxygenase [Gammaproteobacteria bacterium]